MADGKEALGWLYCGNATRMAFNLGLNLDCSKWVATGLISAEEAEVRKVAWWGCYVVDKLFATGLGRPGSTRKSYITCPKPSIIRDSEYSPWAPETPSSDTNLGAHAHIASVSHYVSEHMNISCEAMDEIYAPNSSLSEQAMESLVSSAEVEMRSYYTALPSFLRLPPSPRVPTLPHIYMLQYVRCIPIAAVQDAFTAAVIHLIDARPGDHPGRRQAVRRLEICVGALQDMNLAWNAWSSRALRALQLLAQEWFPSHTAGLGSLSAAIDHGDQAVRPLLGGQETSVVVGAGEDAGGQIDDLGFLFEFSAPEEMDALVRDWLADGILDLPL
ncbi:hypothetical protein Daus18300_007514 [Diaporthe australafricana]|uniref:Xylanolytic transcriptional activator regulatory domain-containing protein n=1 Tax=Diaporthe australafricana TaxID=127596 RepID=A0ABR3WMJ8_9PEZI